MKAKGFPWLLTVLWLMVMALMLRLGFWQLSRAEEKQVMLDTMNLPEPTALTQAIQLENTIDFQKVDVWGHWIEGVQFNLANQFADGKPGFHVYQPMRLFGKYLVLVNRGWVQSENESSPVQGQQSWKMMRSPWPVPAVQLGEQILSQDAVQTLTYLPQNPVEKWLKQRFCGQDKIKNCIILPFVFKLDASMPDGHHRQWQTNIMPPEKHRAYAVQWFTMATVLLLVLIAYFRKTHASKN